MEKIRWADMTDSESEEFKTETETDLESFKEKFRHLPLPISLFIKNISFKCRSDLEISLWASQKVGSQVEIKRNFKKTMFKGDAKVVVSSFDLAYKVLSLSKQEFLGRPLEVRVLESLPKHRKQNSWHVCSSKHNSLINSAAPETKSYLNKLQTQNNIPKYPIKYEEQKDETMPAQKKNFTNPRPARRTNSHFSFDNRLK